MLNNNGFDDWAKTYDKSVAASDSAREYPFAGYAAVLAEIRKLIKEPRGAEILDIGIGTGKFSSRLYTEGARICGIDFSAAMLEKARSVIPEGEFYHFDFKSGLPQELKGRKFDYIISSYAFHHLNDEDKAVFLRSLTRNIKPGGSIIIADVAFKTGEALAACREESGGKWDDSEIYLVAESILLLLEGTNAEYRQISVCAGILTISSQEN